MGMYEAEADVASPSEVADLIDGQVEANDAKGKAEVARLQALIGG